MLCFSDIVVLGLLLGWCGRGEGRQEGGLGKRGKGEGGTGTGKGEKGGLIWLGSKRTQAVLGVGALTH